MEILSVDPGLLSTSAGALIPGPKSSWTAFNDHQNKKSWSPNPFAKPYHFNTRGVTNRVTLVMGAWAFRK